jgi:putative membrane protein insertion efficiency factor
VWRLWQQTPGDDCAVPTLRTRLIRRRLCLALVGLLACAIVVDLSRDPHNQLGSRVYVVGVRGYQAFIRPRTRGFVRCRYRPSCSEYSIEAVQEHGLCTGIRLTASRIYHCRTNVPFGTLDPVPSRDGERDVADGDDRKLD